MNIGGFGDMLQQASRLRGEVQKLQDEMAKKTIETSSGGGMVKVVCNGKQQILSITMDPEVLKLNDQQMLQDLLVAGVNQAIRASQEMMSEEMSKIMGSWGPLASLLKG